MSLLRNRWLEVMVAVVVLASVLVLLVLPDMQSATLTQMSVVSLGVSMMRFGVALVGAFAALRLLDYGADFGFSAIIGRVKNDPLASAVYLGLRFIAVAYLAGVCFS